MPHVHDSLMAADFTDPDKHSTDDSSVSAPTYSPLTVSSNCSEVLHDDFEYDSEDEESFCSAEERVDPIGQCFYSETFVIVCMCECICMNLRVDDTVQ